MKTPKYASLPDTTLLNRRDFVKTLGAGAAALSGLMLGRPELHAATGDEVVTNIGDFMKTPKGPHALPGPFPGKVVQVIDPQSLLNDAIDGRAVRRMFEQGVTSLTGKNMKQSFRMFFTKEDVVGLKVNPVGPPLINTRPELVDAAIDWLDGNGLPRKNIVIWDRFDYMLRDAGFTAERFPGVAIEGLQTMDEKGNSWKGADGRHVSIGNFDMDAFYYAKGIEGKGVRGYTDDENYLNQHVFNNEYSYFGRLVTKKLTKIVNLPAFKNTGNGISMATKNLGYGSLCNTGRLHAPLFFRVCTEVLAAPWIRDKLVLTVTDGIRGQYDGGPDVNAQFVYPNHSLYFATDPFALDMICQQQMVEKRKAMGVKVNEHPRFTDYLRLAEKLELGIADPAKIRLTTLRA